MAKIYKVKTTVLVYNKLLEQQEVACFGHAIKKDSSELEIKRDEDICLRS